MIQDERRRQIEDLGYSENHDSFVNQNDQLGAAAAYYALPPNAKSGLSGAITNLIWPWNRPPKPQADRLIELTKAGALVVAEMDRLMCVINMQNVIGDGWQIVSIKDQNKPTAILETWETRGESGAILQIRMTGTGVWEAYRNNIQVEPTFPNALTAVEYVEMVDGKRDAGY